MNTGNTTVFELPSRRASSKRTRFVRIALASTIACALVTSAYAQDTQAPRDTQRLQAQGARQARAGSLVIPITGTLGGAPTPPAEPPTTPPSEPPTTPPSEPPTTPPSAPPTTPPSEPPTTPPSEPPSTPPPAGPDDDASIPDVTGSFAIRRFAQSTEGELAAVGLLTLSLTNPDSNAARTIVTQAAMPVSVSADAPTDPAAPSNPAAQGCETLSLVLGAVEIEVLGMTVQLKQVNLDFVPRSNGRQGILACGATSVIGNGNGASSAEQMRILNTLLDSIR